MPLLDSRSLWERSGNSVALSGRSALMPKALAAGTGAAAVAARAELAIEAQDSAKGAAALGGAAELQLKAAAAATPSAALAARIAVQVKALAAATGATAASARGTIQLEGSAAATGAAALSGRSTLQLKAQGAVAFFAFLAGRASLMAKATAAATGAAALSGRAAIQAKASGAAAGVSALAGRIANLLQLRGLITSGAFTAALSGRIALTTLARDEDPPIFGNLYICEYALEMFNSVPVARMPPLRSQTVLVTNTPHSSMPFSPSTGMIRMTSDVVCSYEFGGLTVTVNSARRTSGDAEYFAVKPGDTVAVITNV